MKRWLLLVCVLLVLPLSAPAEEAGMTLTADTIRGFQDNPITAFAPKDGTLTLRLLDEFNVYRTICEDLAVKAGENVVHWDGLADNEERLIETTYILSASLRTEDGAELTASAEVTVGRCRQAMIFALGSSEKLYLGGGEEWYAELRAVRAGVMVTEFCLQSDPDTPLCVKRKDMTGGRINKYGWDGVVSGQTLAAGDYLLRFYMEDAPDYAKEVKVTLVAGEKPETPLQLTETFMPERDDTDEEIWSAMMQPSAVITLKPTSHQKVLDQPSRLGHSLGTLHGQSQAVNVLEIRQDGWVKIGAWNHEDGSYIEGYVPADRLTMVSPQTEYGLVLDKQAQTLTVYRLGEKLGTILVSTGQVAKNKLIRETAAGSFLTQEHMSDFSTNGLNYDYVIRFDGGNLLHQAAYRKTGGRKDFTEQQPLLGTKASHGCVRMQSAAGEGGINAYWLWTHIPKNTRLFVLDDPDEREAQARAVSGEAEKAAPEAVASPTDLGEGEKEITLTLGGDVVLGTREEWQADPDALPAYLDRYGMAYPFRNLAELFRADDMTLVNLECVLKEDSAGEDRTKDYRFRGLPSYAQVLTSAGIEQVNLANNHFVDYKRAGQESTRNALTAAGVAFSGMGTTYVYEQDGYKIGFGGCRETTYREDSSVIRRDIAALQDAGCDVIIYSCHFGTEYSKTHNAYQEKMARAAVSAGANLVIGHHPHVVQGIDTVDSAVVLYSLGNLMFGGTHEMVTYDGMLAQVKLRFGATGYEGLTLRLLPVLTSSGAGVNDFCPTLAGSEDAARILAQVQSDSTILLSDAMFFPAE